jgi:hypothetical protein
MKNKIFHDIMVRVVCRIKPPIRSNTRLTNDGKLLFTKIEKDLEGKEKYSSKLYKLDHFYNENDSNEHIYKNEVNELLNDSFCLFLYGHTGSGKTYTLLGNNKSNGIIQLLLKKINYDCHIEVMELRPTGCYDLKTNKIVTLFENNNKIKLDNLSKTSINNSYDFNNILSIINNYRVKGSSKHNSSSSRTHLLINIYHNNFKYTLIDLAGNERDPIMKKGILYSDTNYINTSLLALKECFRKINSSYIPYRRTKLTRLLKNVFEKKINSLIITTIHSGFQFQNETNDTLSYITQFHSKFELIPNSYSLSRFKKPSRRPPPIITTQKKYDILKRPKTSPKLSNNIYQRNNNYIPKKVYHLKLDPLKKKYNIKNNNDNKVLFINNNKPINNYLKENKKIDYSHKYIEDTKKYIDKLNKFKDIVETSSKIYYNDKENKSTNEEVKSRNKEEESYNDNLKIIKYQPKNLDIFYIKARKSFQVLNHILYSRTIKNYVRLNQMEEINEIDPIIQSTLSTIEIILSELTKLTI